MVEAARVLVLVELHGQHGREQREQLKEERVGEQRLRGGQGGGPDAHKVGEGGGEEGAAVA